MHATHVQHSHQLLCGAHSCSPQLIAILSVAIRPFLCVYSPRCHLEYKNVIIPSCQLQRKTNYRPIELTTNYNPLFSKSTYQIYSPGYYGRNEYPNNTYCVWNVTNTGLVSYRIVDLQLQEPSDCNGSGCACPDSVKISAGANEIIFCGSQVMSLYQISSNGLQVKFCSDNQQSAKGFLINATRFCKYI